ncbi:MAG: hypothetical protein M3Y50_12865 [Acidobacteriota bacterium]|nr:hypothetical protein [Acidobacteriota bacterium]
MATWSPEQAKVFYIKRQRSYGKFLLSNLKGALRSVTEIRDTAEHRQTDTNRGDRTEYEDAEQLRIEAQCLIDDLIDLLENDHAGARALFGLIEGQAGEQQTQKHAEGDGVAVVH